MAHELFEDFLGNAERYHAVERYWEQMVRDIAESLGQSGEWQRWIPRYHPNGMPFELDGNPIFDGRSQRLNRAFRIIQHPATGDKPEIAAWLKTYEAEFPDLPREELVLNLSLSGESANAARELLAKWMTPETNPKGMQSFIRERLDHDSESGSES